MIHKIPIIYTNRWQKSSGITKVILTVFPGYFDIFSRRYQRLHLGIIISITSPYYECIRIYYVTGASVHEPRQRNSLYKHMFQWFVYMNICPKHPYLTILLSSMTPSYPLLHGPVTYNLDLTWPNICYFRVHVHFRVYAIAISVYVAISMKTMTLHQESNHCCVSSLTRETSLL